MMHLTHRTAAQSRRLRCRFIKGLTLQIIIVVVISPRGRRRRRRGVPVRHGRSVVRPSRGSSCRLPVLVVVVLVSGPEIRDPLLAERLELRVELSSVGGSHDEGEGAVVCVVRMNCKAVSIQASFQRLRIQLIDEEGQAVYGAVSLFSARDLPLDSEGGRNQLMQGGKTSRVQ